MSNPTNRRHFMRQLGQAVLAGVGLAAIGAGPAHAAVTCCYDGSCPTCSGTPRRFRCSGCPGNPCICFTSSNRCVSVATCP